MASNKRHRKEREKIDVMRILPNTEHNAQKINEHNLETKTAACEHLNYLRHVNLLLGKYGPQIVDKIDVFIWTIFNLFDSDCIIDSKVRVNLLMIPKFLLFAPSSPIV